MTEETEIISYGRHNIAVFSNTLQSGGAEKQAILLAKNLRKYHNVILIIYYGEDLELHSSIIQGLGFDVIGLKGNHAMKVLQLYRILRQNKINILFSYLLTTNLLGAVVGRLAGVNFCIGGIRNAVLSKSKLPIQRFLHNYLNYHTIYNNYRGLNELGRHGFNSNKASVIPNCHDTFPGLRVREYRNTTRILSVGRFVPQKGFDVALKAVRLLIDKQYNLTFTLVGFGLLERDLRDQIEYLGLTKHVELKIMPSDISSIYSKSDIYLCSSRFEGLSNTIMEAMSHSLPIVATDVGDNRKLVQDQRNGIIVDKLEPENLAQALMILLTDPELRKEYGKESYQILNRQYGENVFRQRYLRFINELYRENEPVT